MEFARKRANPDTAAFANGGSFKKSKEAKEFFTTGVGSKSKPCMKFYSPSGCSFGDTCHFLHYVPGYSAVTQMNNLGTNPAAPIGRNGTGLASVVDGPVPNVKTKLCHKFSTPEGCKFGDKCHFAHSEMELGKPVLPGHGDARAIGPLANRFSGSEPLPPGLHAAANFGLSATTKISIDASLAGAVIGKGGINSKQICRLSGVKLSVKEHDTDPNLRNIELEGTYDQINHASNMVRELITNISTTSGAMKNSSGFRNGTAPANNYKKKMCENFAKGSCTYGERCHFAHGESELRKTVV